MSRPQKIHKPIKGSFNNILASVAAGTGRGKKASEKATRSLPVKPATPAPKKP
jgi:hypothetical protein